MDNVTIVVDPRPSVDVSVLAGGIKGDSGTMEVAFRDIVDLGDVSGTVDLDWSLAIRYKANLIGNTTLTFSNVTDYVGVKTQQLELTSALDTYTLTHPTGVDVANDLSDVDLTLTNHITYFCHRLVTPFYQSSVKTE